MENKSLMMYAEMIADAIDGTVGTAVKNGIEMVAVKWSADGEVGCMFWAEKWFRDGLSVDGAIAIARKCIEHRKQIDMVALRKRFDSYENVKDDLYIRIMHKGGEKAGYVYRSAAEYGFDDLIIVPYVDVPTGMVGLTEKHIARWDVSADEIIDRAIRQTKYEISRVGDAPMLVVADENSGAGAIIAARQELKEVLGEYIAIPSSVHEFLIIPKLDEEDLEYANQMVKDVNAESVDPLEVLSDHVYQF